MNSSFKKSGFTLMEVLVASAIFAVILIIATVTIAETSDFRSRLKTMRETSEASRNLADMLTRDIHAANSMATITDDNGTLHFRNGLAILQCSEVANSCVFASNSTPYPTYVTSYGISDGNPFGTTAATGLTPVNATVLVVSTKDEYRIYVSGGMATIDPVSHVYSWTNRGIFYKKFPHSGLGSLSGDTVTKSDILGADGISGIINQANMITPQSIEIAVNLVGFCQNDESFDNASTALSNKGVGKPGKQQSYIVFNILSETAKYAILPGSQRYQTHIISAATSSSYNY